MNSTSDRAAVASALDAAHALVDMGMPIFVARLSRGGDPMPPPGWERTRPDHAMVARWRPGLALCAVTGVAFDVLDIDPRNGGKASFDAMAEELGDDGPEVYWRVKTPSGGLHLYVAPLDIGSHNGFRPGLDLKGGRADGSSRGFVFLPPTVRPSKVTGTAGGYAPSNGAPRPGGEVCEPLADYIESALADRPDPVGGLLSGGRQKPDALRAACLGAPAGAQRDALLRYVHELERKGYEPDDIVALCMGLVLEMPTYDVDRPWRERDIRSLLHRSGEVVGDASADEMAGPIELRTAGLVLSAADIHEKTLSWLWDKYLAFGELTLLDGEKGVGKSSVCDDITARATRGRGMPGVDGAGLVGPINVMIFTDEGQLTVLKRRLRAAGADLSRVFFNLDKPPKKVRGQIKAERRAGFVEEWELALPDGAPAIAARIREAGAGLVIFDPITDYLTSRISTNNDASVRLALRPLGAELAKLGAAGLAIRHMNKNRALEAKFRGGGTTAFQNRSRVHLVMGRIPVEAAVEGGSYGVAMVDSNLTQKVEGVLTYDIVDSDEPLDDLGNMIGKVEWRGICDVDADSVTRGEDSGRRRGPAPTTQLVIREILEAMFHEKDLWRASDAVKELETAGFTDHKTYDKVTAAMGIRKFRVPRRGGGTHYFWTTRKERVSEAGERGYGRG